MRLINVEDSVPHHFLLTGINRYIHTGQLTICCTFLFIKVSLIINGVVIMYMSYFRDITATLHERHRDWDHGQHNTKDTQDQKERNIEVQYCITRHLQTP